MSSYIGEIKASWMMFITFTGKINVISLLFLYYVFFIFELVTNCCIFLVHKAMAVGVFTLGMASIPVMFIQVFEVDLQLPL